MLSSGGEGLSNGVPHIVVHSAGWQRVEPGSVGRMKRCRCGWRWSTMTVAYCPARSPRALDALHTTSAGLAFTDEEIDAGAASGTAGVESAH